MQTDWPPELDDRFRSLIQVLKITNVDPGYVVSQARESVERWQALKASADGRSHSPEFWDRFAEIANEVPSIVTDLLDSATMERARDILVQTEQLNNTLRTALSWFLHHYRDEDDDLSVVCRQLGQELDSASAVTATSTDRFNAAAELAESERQQRELTEQALRKAEEAAGRAGRAADAAQLSAGASGAFDLSSYFGEYATSELRTADRFRLLTIGVLISILVAAVALHSHDFGNLSETVYRVTILAALSALVAYFSSQASHHRKSGVWARGMQIQLQSFPAFMEPLATGESRDSIYVAFAARVLGAPPVSAKNAPQDPALMQSVMDVLLKRAS